MYPLKFQPVYKEKVWGRESWEICSHSEGLSIVKNGAFYGKTIVDLFEENGEVIFGKSVCSMNKEFPMLIKFIDANDRLSVQVHPTDDYARVYENGTGKTEMWYVIDAYEDSYLIYGLKEGVSKDDFIKSIQDQSVEDILHEINVKAGDILFIPSGTIHAIGKGILIAEIQQNCDITYRVFDWNRVGIDGKPRELHIDKALDVINFGTDLNQYLVKGFRIEKEGYSRTIYVSCEYFTTEVLDIQSMYDGNLDGDRFEIFMCVEGNLNIYYDDGKCEGFTKGDTILLPASLGDFKVEGMGTVIRIYMVESIELVNCLLDEGYSREDLMEIRGIENFLCAID